MGNKSLGKGLNSIFNDKAINKVLPEINNLSSQKVKLSKIDSNPFQPRKNFEEKEIIALALTIKEHGLIQPIALRKTGNRFEIIAGERRYRACKYLEHSEIDAKVFEKITDLQMAEWAIIENIQRVELSPVEEANSYQELINNHNYSHEDLATKMGKSRPAISNTLRLLKLPLEVQAMVEKKLLSAGHARNLLSIEDPQELIDLAERICREGLSVRDVEEIRQSKSKKSNNKITKIPDPKDPHVGELESSLQYAFGTKVDVSMKRNKTGSIKVHFSSVSDLNRIKDILDQGIK